MADELNLIEILTWVRTEENFISNFKGKVLKNFLPILLLEFEAILNNNILAAQKVPRKGYFWRWQNYVEKY